MCKLAEDWRARAAAIHDAVENGLPIDGNLAMEMTAIANTLEKCADELDGNVVMKQEDYDTVMSMLRDYTDIVTGVPYEYE